MDKLTKLTDFIRINPNKSIVELSDDKKQKLIDSVMSGDPKTRGLIITFDLSHSGKRINNRIYPPWGQKAGVESWTSPFEKPIIRDHKLTSDNTIGRFISVEYVSQEADAIRYLGDISRYVKLKRAFDTKSPIAIYKAMDEAGVLTSKDWPGLGKLIAKARITDKEAIEKFLDGRYLTFSAGSATDSFSCMVCGSGWHVDGPCEHAPGMTDEDGKVGTAMTGIFVGREASVVGNPADNLAVVRSLQLVDSIEATIDNKKWMHQGDEPSYIFTDCEIEVPVVIADETPISTTSLEDLLELDTRTIASLLADGKIDFDLTDALEGNSHLESAWLIRMHDSLHYENDFALEHESDSTSTDKIPTDVFKLHGALHDISMDKGFRGSLVNGPIDYFDEQGSPATKYVQKKMSSDSAESTESILNTIKDMLMEIVNKDNDTSAEDATNDSASEKNELEVQDGSESGVPETQTKEEAQEEEEVKDSETEEAETSKVSEEVLDFLRKHPEGITAETVADLVGVDNIDAEELVDDDTIDWGLLDLAMGSLLSEDAKLSTEARNKLPASSFCGPERSFPVPDCAHVTAARRLIGRAKLSSAQKSRVLACVNRKAKNMSCDSENDSCKNCENCKCKNYDALSEDYTQALKQVDSLKQKLENVLDSYAKVSGKEISDSNNDNRLDLLVGWFDNINTTGKDKSLNIDNVQVVSDPTDQESKKDIEVKASADKQENKDLTSYEQRVLTNYKQLRDNRGIRAAEQYLARQRRYVRRTFDPTKLLD